MSLLQVATSQLPFDVLTTSEENASLPFDMTSNEFELELIRYADVCKLKNLVLEFNEQLALNTNNWKDYVSDIKLVLFGGGAEIIHIPIFLLCEITNPTISNNKLVITIPDYFTFDIMLVALPYHVMKLKIICANNHIRSNITSIDVLATYIFYEEAHRQRLSQVAHEKIIHQLNTMETVRNTRQARVQINDGSFTKGYFINTRVNNIKHMSLRLNGIERFVYDEIMINVFCNKISDDLLYVPFAYRDVPNFMSETPESFIGALNSSRIDSVEMILETNNECDFRICSVNGNFVRIMSGMIGTDRIIPPYRAENTYIASYIVPQTNILTATNNSVQTIWTEENRVINDRNRECPISYVEFTSQSKYCCCSTCGVNYDDHSLKTYFASQRDQRAKCPTCRSVWTNFVVYTNIEE